MVLENFYSAYNHCRRKTQYWENRVWKIAIRLFPVSLVLGYWKPVFWPATVSLAVSHQSLTIRVSLSVYCLADHLAFCGSLDKWKAKNMKLDGIKSICPGIIHLRHNNQWPWPRFGDLDLWPRCWPTLRDLGPATVRFEISPHDLEKSGDLDPDLVTLTFDLNLEISSVTLAW